MDFNDGKKMYESFKRQPIKTIIIIILLLMFLAASAYITGFFGEKAKGHSNTFNSNGKSERVNQATEGDKSPAIVSDGNVNLEYGDDK